MEKLMDCFILPAHKCNIYKASVKIHLEDKVVIKDVILINGELYTNEINDLYLMDSGELVCIEKHMTDDLVEVYVLKSAKHSNTYKKMQLLNAECSYETKLFTNGKLFLKLVREIEKLCDEGALLESSTFEIDGIKYEVYADYFPLDKELHIQF
jgi:hypothetical protein